MAEIWQFEISKMAAGCYRRLDFLLFTPESFVFGIVNHIQLNKVQKLTNLGLKSTILCILAVILSRDGSRQLEGKLPSCGVAFRRRFPVGLRLLNGWASIRVMRNGMTDLHGLRRIAFNEGWSTYVCMYVCTFIQLYNSAELSELRDKAEKILQLYVFTQQRVLRRFIQGQG